MTVDLMCVFPQEAVELSRVRILLEPVRSVEVIGSDFRAVDSVLINNLESPDWVVLSKNKLLAQLPDGIHDRVLTVTVLSKRLVASQRSVLRFRIGSHPGKVRGIQRLVQLFLKILLTTQGSDIFGKRIGGNALRNVGATYSSDRGGDILNDLVIAVDQTTKQIVAIQARRQRLPRDEKLLSAKVVSASFNKEAGGLDVVVNITSQAGEAATANLGI